MLRIFESFEETAHRCFRELRAAARRDKITRPKYAETIEGVRYSFTARRDTRPAPMDSDDLPKPLKNARPSLKNTYRALRALCDGRPSNPGVEVWPSDVVAWLDAQEIDAPNSVDTINHALRDLRTLRLAHSRPDSGWHLGLLSENRQASVSEIIAYCSDMADLGVRRFHGLNISRSFIWVPGEIDTLSGQVMVTDDDTGRVVSGGEHIGKMQIPTRAGRLSTVTAARGELVCADEKYATVKIGGEKIKTRLLGEWQLRGLNAPDTREKKA